MKEGRPGLYWSKYVDRGTMMAHSELWFKGEPVERIRRLLKESEDDFGKVAETLNDGIEKDHPLFVSPEELPGVIEKASSLGTHDVHVL